MPGSLTYLIYLFYPPLWNHHRTWRHHAGTRACPFHISHPHIVSCQLKMPGHTPQASTAPLQNLSAKLIKARHCLHACNLQVETIRTECDKARREVEASDTEISGMEHEEERLKLQYVESAPSWSYTNELHSRRAAPPGSLLPLEPAARRASR